MTRDDAWRLALLEAQVNASTDGILVVDERGTKVFQNGRVAELFGLPAAIAAQDDDGPQRRWAAAQTVDPVAFVAMVTHLMAHPFESSRDDVVLTNGTILDRHTSPVVGQHGEYFGRVWTFRDVTSSRAREQSLQLLGAAVQQARESIVITDAMLDAPGPRILFVNPAFTRMTGYGADDVIGRTPRLLQGPRTDQATLRRMREQLTRGETFDGEVVNYRRNGEAFDLEWHVAPIVDAAGAITHFVAIQHDVTERNRIAAQLMQSQKLETVGRLAGGVAHEFNSILTAIIGQSQMLLDGLPSGSGLSWHAREISEAAGRASVLTRQLLAYGRKQWLHPERVDLNAMLVGMAGVLRILMGPAIDTRMVHAAGLTAIHADAAQLEQVIMNIALNARDAMPNGGTVTFETAAVTVDPDGVGRWPDLVPGRYAMLAITDSGRGMTEEVRAHVFEPFFSTKLTGAGTGLGLSTCYGIIKQSRGHIAVYSEPGRGTTFRVYLPEMVPADGTAPRPSAPARAAAARHRDGAAGRRRCRTARVGGDPAGPAGLPGAGRGQRPRSPQPAAAGRERTDRHPVHRHGDAADERDGAGRTGAGGAAAHQRALHVGLSRARRRPPGPAR
jgi:PAS domain S-box-containing protein